MISAQGLCTSRTAGHIAIEGVDFSVARGEVLCVCGRPESGLATLFGIFASRITPSQGTAKIANVSCVEAPTVVRQHAVFVNPAQRWYPHLTVRENLRVFVTLSMGSRERVRHELDDVLRITGIPEIAFDSLVGRLGNGIGRLLWLALARARKSAAIVLEVPTVGVEDSDVVWLSEAIQDLARDGAAVLLSTSDLEFARSLGGRVCYMRAGQFEAMALSHRESGDGSSSDQ